MGAGPQNGNGYRQAGTDGAPAQATGSASLLAALLATVDSALEQARTIAATAATEARLSAAALVALAATAAIALAFLLVAGLCLLALGVWLAVRAGLPAWAALAGAVLVNLAGAALCRWWIARLLPHLGFARTRRLLADPD